MVFLYSGCQKQANQARPGFLHLPAAKENEALAY